MEATVMQNQTDETTALITEVDSIKTIATADQYQRVATLRGLIKDMIKDHESRANPRIEEAKQHLKNLRDDLAKLTDPLEQKYKTLGGLMSTYNTEQERIKRQRELEIEAELRRKAEQERKELAALAKEMGDKQLAKEIKAQPIEVAPVVVTKDVPKVEGLSYSENWHYEVTSFAELVAAVANGLEITKDGKKIEFYVFRKIDGGQLEALGGAGRVPIQALHDITKPFRSGYLNSMATRLKSTLQYPGVKVWMTKDPRQK